MELLSVAELARRLLDSLLFILSESQHRHSPGTERRYIWSSVKMIKTLLGAFRIVWLRSRSRWLRLEELAPEFKYHLHL